MENLLIINRWAGPFAGRLSVRSDLSWRFLCGANGAARPKRPKVGQKLGGAGFGQKNGFSFAGQDRASQAVSNKTAAVARASVVMFRTCEVVDRCRTLERRCSCATSACGTKPDMPANTGSSRISMNSVRRAPKVGLLLTDYSAGCGKSSLDQDQVKRKSLSQAGDLNLAFGHREVDLTSLAGETIQKASRGTTSHCSSGLRPVPRKGSLGMISRYAHPCRTSTFHHSENAV